ncbi:MAG TPA: invasion associated locus B family protein [Hyphomicrobium sp.]|nr:invasion associated locus B family protein [Hyphomicrobium sp.]
MALCRRLKSRRFCLFPFKAAAVVAALVPGLAHAQSVTKLTSIVDWSLYTDSEKPHAFCFLTSAPKSSAPAGSGEGPRVYISAWPKEGVKAEPSFKLGFTAKKGSEITAAVGTQTFSMFAQSGRAYVADATAELKLIEAMRKGSKLAVTATNEAGTSVTDTYSLAGVGQAMQELQATCF